MFPESLIKEAILMGFWRKNTVLGSLRVPWQTSFPLQSDNQREGLEFTQILNYTEYAWSVLDDFVSPEVWLV